MEVGDRVAVCAGNGWEFAVATYAVYKMGAVLVSLPSLLSKVSSYGREEANGLSTGAA